MIIQIRGTSGSGKSTVVKNFMGLENWNSRFSVGRKKPLYYQHESRPIVVLGHYESACGGCDTIGSAPKVYDLIKSIPSEFHIVCEGLLLSEDVKWTHQLFRDGYDVRVIFLTTPLAQCLSQVKSRREEAGNSEPLNPKNTENRVAVIERARIKLRAAGIVGVRLNSSQVVGKMVEWLA